MRSSPPMSFIFLFDNVLGADEEKDPEKGQRFRTAEELEAIFARAGLRVHAHSEVQKMPGSFMNVKIWALY